RRGRARGRELGVEERQRRALQVADRIGCVLPRNPLRRSDGRNRTCAESACGARAGARPSCARGCRRCRRACSRAGRRGDGRRDVIGARLRTLAMIAALGSLAFLVATWIARPFVSGDTPFVLDGTNAFLNCLSQHDYNACGYTGRLNYWGLMSPVGRWTLLQHSPDMITIGLGGDGHPARTRVLASLSVAGVVGSVALGGAVLRRCGRAEWFWAFMAIVLTGPILAYARETFGEMLA